MENITISKNEYEQLLLYRDIVTMMEEVLHERPFREDFVRRTEKIRKEMHEGRKTHFKSVEELDKYLKKE